MGNGLNAAGEMTSGAGRSYSWTAAGKPWKITQSGAGTRFRYGPGGHIYRQVRQAGLNNETVVETFSPYLKVIQAGGATTLVNRILVHGRAVALFKVSGTGSVMGLAYLHRDRLGSVIAVTDGSGNVTSRSAYGVWGQRVSPASWKGTASPGTLSETHHGYTGHKELADVGLIHLGGRVYAPRLGRFVSADPTLQAPYSPQDLNRYSYVVNSPMNAIDPTGYGIFSFVGDLLGGAIGALGNLVGAIVNGVGDILGYVADGLEHIGQELKNHWKLVVVAVAAVFTAGIAAAALYAYLATSVSLTVGVATVTISVATSAEMLAVAAVTGAVAGGVLGAGMTALNGGSLGDVVSNGLKGAAVGAFAGAATFGAGYIAAGSGFVGQTVAHGVAGGLTGMVSGGSFQKGFGFGMLAYAASSLYKYYVNGENPRWGRGHGAVMKRHGHPEDITQGVNDFSIANYANKHPELVGSYVTTPCGGCEGSAISVMVDGVPGMNALSALHDVWGAMFERAFGSYPEWFSIGTMLPAAALSYTGLMNTPIGYGIMSSDTYWHEGGG